MIETREIIIVGGGLAGLTAALHLAERGLRPLVLEADPLFAGGRVGGKPATTLRDATGREWHFAAEHGIHGIWSQYLNLKAMLERHNITPAFVEADRQEWLHGVGGKVKRAEMGRVVRRTVWPAPFHYGALFFRPSFWRMLTARDWLSISQVLGSLIVASGVDPLGENITLEGKSLADFCEGWPPAMRAFIASLARSGLSAHPEDVPLSGFIAFLRFYTLLSRDSQAFLYMAGDADSALIDPLVKRISRMGGEVRLGQRVTALEKADSWQITTAGGAKLQAKQVVLATDAPATRQLLLASPTTREIAQRMVWPGAMETAIIRFWFKNSPPPKAEAGIVSGDFTVDNFFWLQRFQTQFAEWHKATGGSAVEMHIYGPAELVARPNAELLSRAQSDIERMYPALRGNIIHQTLQRNPGTHTLFAVGSLARHLGVRTPWPGLFACGDWVRHVTPALFLERATVTGIAAASAAVETLGQPAFRLVPHYQPEPLAKLTGLWMRAIRSSVRGTKSSPQKYHNTKGIQ